MQKLMNIDRRIIYFTMLVLVSLPLLNPLGIPLEINKGTRDVFEQLDAVPAGKRVLFSINYDPTSAADIAPQAKVMLEHLMSKNVKVALVCFSAAGPALIEGLIGANRYQRLSVNRGFFRQTGLVATALLMAVTLIGHNLVSLHAWHTTRGRPEPWQIHLGEPVDDRPLDTATRTRGRRSRPID